jgi:hypothetical protein
LSQFQQQLYTRSVFLQVDIDMLGLARALAPVAQPRLGRAAFPLLQRCCSYCQALSQNDSYSSSSKPRREVFVDNADDLDEVLESCNRSEYIAMDTEFVAFPSLVPKLQLVQVHRHYWHRFPCSVVFVKEALSSYGCGLVLDLTINNSCGREGSSTHNAVFAAVSRASQYCLAFVGTLLT